jgi:hypothetical protein
VRRRSRFSGELRRHGSRKLELLTQDHPVRLVAPVAVGRRIVRLSDEGEVLSAHRSPRRGRIEDIFSRLVSIPSLLCLPRFELEIVLTHQDELRVHRPGKAFRRRGWVVTGRRLVSVEERRLLATPADAAGLLPLALPELFDTAELAQAAGIQRRLAQQMTYCLRAMGVLDTAGKRSGAVVHRRADATTKALKRRFSQTAISAPLEAGGAVWESDTLFPTVKSRGRARGDATPFCG